MKMTRLALVCLALMSSARAFAQDIGNGGAPPAARSWLRASVASPLGTGTPPHQLWKPDDLIERQEANSTRQTTNQGRSWVGRHPVLTGALIGAGVGAALAATGDKEPGASKPALIVFTAGIGAATGALIGRAFR
jgi:hypothetical protein